jgi:hypothetical protein
MTKFSPSKNSRSPNTHPVCICWVRSSICCSPLLGNGAVAKPGAVPGAWLGKMPFARSDLRRHTIARGLCYAVGRPPEQKCRRSWPVEWWTNSLLFGGELGIDAEHGVLRLNDGTHDNGNIQCLLGGVYWALRFVKRADAPFRALRILKLSYPVMVNKLQS